jgi:hypothetical protein
MKKNLAVVAMGFMAVTSLVAQSELNPFANRPDGRGNVPRHIRPRGEASAAGTTGNGINYNGGPVMLGTTHIYYIWYGNWAGLDANGPQILNDFADNIGGSPYFNINSTYFDGTNTNVSNSVIRSNSITGRLANSPTSLTDANIWTIVQNAIYDGLGTDPNGVYFVLTAPGISETSGFLTKYCGWHTYGSYNGTYIKYSFVGNASGPNLGNCAWQTTSSPNNDPGADAMVSVIAHELEESVTDPQLNAWYDSTGAENADKCAWTFGTTYNASNGGLANITLGTRNYLIQRNWVNASGGFCAMSYVTTPDFSLSVSPSSQSVTQGGTTGNYTVTVNPTNGFTGSVTLSVSGLPTGATANAFSVNPTTSTSTFTVTTSSGLSAGTYPFTITGTSTGSNGTLTHTASATLIVNPAGTFTLSISPTSLTVRRGSSGTYKVTVTGNGGFNSNVQLSVSGLPGRTSATFSPNPVGGGSGNSTLTIIARTNTSTGTRTITVVGTSGSLTSSVKANLTIQ